jgi:malonate transporter and related proteins
VMAGLAGAYGNIGYMGPGLALAAFGPQAAVPVALIFCFDSVFLFSIVPLLMALFHTERRPLLPTIVHVAKQILFHPLIIASWLGALAAALHLDPPVAVDRTLQFLQSAAAPVALFALGVTVALRPFDRVPWEVPGVIAVKLLVQPLIAFATLSLLGPFDREWVATALLMASLPPALNAFIIARQYNTWVEASSTTVLVGTMVSVLTLTTIMWLLGTGQLPIYP